MKTLKLMGTTALAILTGITPTLAQVTAVGDGEGEVSIVAWAGYIEPVSYTHLDVYKRQEMDGSQ